MEILTTFSALALLFIHPIDAKSYADEVYEKQRAKALTPGASKSYRKKSRGEKKPHTSSGEKKSRRFKGEDQAAHHQVPSSEVLVEHDIAGENSGSEPLFGESVPQERMPYVNSDFEKWEIRPIDHDETALTQDEIELIKAHYENSENDLSNSFPLHRTKLR